MNDSTLGAAAALCRRAGGWTSESSLVSRRHPDPMPPCKRDLQYLWRQMRLQINCLPESLLSVVRKNFDELRHCGVPVRRAP
jgi:hypothetical protein